MTVQRPTTHYDHPMPVATVYAKYISAESSSVESLRERDDVRLAVLS